MTEQFSVVAILFIYIPKKHGSDHNWGFRNSSQSLQPIDRSSMSKQAMI
jgi:hypothetical protein